jgi:hypothetical protein
MKNQKTLEAQHVSDAVSWQSCPAIFAQRDIAEIDLKAISR